MLMDLFFSAAPVAAKRRVHFHEFMRDVHAALHRRRQEDGRRDSDPLPLLAREIAKSAWLLCFDELQVTDIADAMILGRLFEALFAQGVVMVMTSNRPPDDLYKDGLQRERFLPFIAHLKRYLDLLALDSQGDYRLGRKKGLQVYYTPLGADSEGRLAAGFDRLTGGTPPLPVTVDLMGRSLTVPKSAEGVAWFTFAELCQRPLGAADYLKLATLFHTIMMSAVPILSPENRDAAKRFVTLIDALYEHKTTFLCSAAAPPQSLYAQGDGSFEFQRTVSRLMEMQSRDYLGHAHLT
jgi:cell division protein ZapE